MFDPAKPPSGVGLGLRWAFLDEVAAGNAPSSVRFFEVSPENYMRRGGSIPSALDVVARDFPIITHGLMMNVGGTTELDPHYLAELRSFCERMGSPTHSDHLCWSGSDGAILHDLLPLTHDGSAVRRCVDQIRRIRDALGRPFAIENISYYLVPAGPLAEAELISEILERADCGLLLDVNNVAVNAANHGFDPIEMLQALPLSRVVQLHVAGGERRPHLDNLLIDTHGSDVNDEVRGLMEWAIERVGPVPVIYERDHDIPPLAQLGEQVEVLQEAYDRGLARYEARAQVENASPPRDATRSLPEVRSMEGVQRGFSRIIVDQAGEDALAEDPAGWLRAHGVEHPDEEAMARIGVKRLLVYRTMVRGGLISVTRNFVPRTVARLGEDGFARAVGRWLHESPPTSRYLRDVPAEFVRWATERWPDDDTVAPYLVDLARLEIIENEIDAAPDPAPPADMQTELVLDRPLVWNGALALARFEHAVHTLPSATADKIVPAEESTRLLVYRDNAHAVRTLKLSALAYEVLQRLIEHGATVAVAIPQGAVASGEAVNDEVLGRLSALLADLAERGVLRGCAGAPKAP